MSMDDSTFSGPAFNVAASLMHKPDLHLEIGELYPDLSDEEVDEAVTYFNAAVGGGWPALPGIVDQIKRQRSHRALENLHKQFNQPEHKEEHMAGYDSAAHQSKMQQIKEIRAAHPQLTLWEAKTVQELRPGGSDDSVATALIRHREIVADAVTKTEGIDSTALNVELAKTKQDLDDALSSLQALAQEQQAWEEQKEKITTRLHELAEDQGWCDRFDEEMIRHGLRPRIRKHTVRARMTKGVGGEMQEFYIEAWVTTGLSDPEATKAMLDYPAVKALMGDGWEMPVGAWVHEDRDDDEDY